MARVLIVEDLEAKYRAVEGLVREQLGIDAAWSRSISAAYGVVDSNWDLVLLDMNFHVADDFNKHSGKAAMAGVELLQFMTARALQTPVIVITAHDSFGDSDETQVQSIEALDRLLLEDYPDLYRGAVKVEYSTNDWHDELLSKIRSALEDAT